MPREPSIAPFLSAIVQRLREKDEMIQADACYAQYLRFSDFTNTLAQTAWTRQLDQYASSVQRIPGVGTSFFYKINALGLHYQLVDAGDFDENAAPSNVPTVAHTAAVPLCLDSFLSSMVNAPRGQQVIQVSGQTLYDLLKAFEPRSTATLTAFGRATKVYALSVNKRSVQTGVQYTFDMERVRKELIHRRAYDTDVLFHNVDVNSDDDDDHSVSRDVYSSVYT